MLVYAVMLPHGFEKLPYEFVRLPLEFVRLDMFTPQRMALFAELLNFALIAAKNNILQWQFPLQILDYSAFIFPK